MLRDLEPTWTWFFDQVVPRHVKQVYSPRESWRGKPFTRADAAFFVRGVRELSTRLTLERIEMKTRGRERAYLEHSRFRSAYLLYFLPLQAAKLAQLYRSHSGAIDAAVAEGARRGRLVIADLGAGPGTASIALLLHLAHRQPTSSSRKGAGSHELPPITLQWFDVERRILDDGRAIVRELIDHLPTLRGRVEVETAVMPWTEAVTQGRDDWGLALLAHTLNEGKAPPPAIWKRAVERVPRGGGLLIVEPAIKNAAHRLARLRDELLTTRVVAPRDTSIWGPCLHAGRCPLSSGRDWCHLSVPATIPGEWFAFFSRGLGSERNWLKYSYLWFAAAGDPSPSPPPRLRRVLTDPLRGSKGREVLLCEPNKPNRMRLEGSRRIGRGDLFTISAPPRP